MEKYLSMIESKVSGDYVSPLYPKTGEDVKISIRTTGSVSSVTLFITVNGEENRIACQIKNDFGSAITQLKNGSSSLYYFSLIIDNRYYYYSNIGLTAYVPAYRAYFEITPDIMPASWISSANCYQIFPDRFKNGNPAIDVKDGQYQFDGGIVKHMNFTDKPLSFEEGKCLDFFGGDFQGIIDSIDYFKTLNINTLYLNPIGVSFTTHRYDCCDFFHIDPKLGGDDKFIDMVNALHDNGIKIIVDISINHTGTNHPWFIKANEDSNNKETSYYYIDKDGRVAFWEDVPTLPQLNYSNKELCNIIYNNKDSVLRKFLNPPFNQDGWRLDVANVVGRRGSDQLTHEIWRDVRKAVKEEKSDAYLVGECWNDANPYLQGDEWDASMNYIGCGRPIRRWMGERDRFNLDGWGQNPTADIPFTGSEMKGAIKSQLDDMKGQMRYFQMNLVDSHDTPRLHNNNLIMDIDIYNGAMMLMYLLPGMPSLYYGDEIGLDGKLNCVENWRYPMEWDSSKWNMNLFNNFKALGKLRLDYSNILATGTYGFLDTDDNMMSFTRSMKNNTLLLVLNRGKKRDIKLNRDFMVGNTITTLLGYGSAYLEGNSIICNLEKNKSLILLLK
ncbi:MAG: glycoside hydrolase family 13 protein [Spirochaetaceae bacterium]|nr:glycoside hydrolase family 13 protein [Spirochaetaceae bacterium]